MGSRALISAITASLLAAWACAQDSGRPDLSIFDLRSFSVLKDFRPHSVTERPQRSSLTTGYNQSVLEGRCFHGPSEVRYLVLWFRSPQALRQWDKPELAANWSVGRPVGSKGSPEPVKLSWRPPMSKKEIAASKAYLRRDMQRRNLAVDDQTLALLTQSRVHTWRSTVISAQTAIVVFGHQHEAMVRRGQAKATQMLTDQQIAQVVEKVTRELLRRAERRPDAEVGDRAK